MAGIAKAAISQPWSSAWGWHTLLLSKTIIWRMTQKCVSVGIVNSLSYTAAKAYRYYVMPKPWSSAARYIHTYVQCISSYSAASTAAMGLASYQMVHHSS